MIGILTDVTKCIGCNKCVDACVEENGLEKHVPSKQGIPDGLGAERFTSVIKVHKNNGPRFVRKQCRHCVDPACASACIVGALHKTKEGAVVYDADKCMGCRYCMMACPFAIPRYNWEDAVHYVRKCKLCHDNRIVKGKPPACTEACPEGATIFGERDELIKEAKKRIAQNPDRYVPKVYGEKVVGGTSVLYLSDVSLDFLGWSSELPDKPLPQYTWKVLKKVPYEFLGVGALMGGIYWITGRRAKVAEAEGNAASEDVDAADAGDDESTAETGEKE